MSGSIHRKKFPTPVVNGNRNSRTRRSTSRCVSYKSSLSKSGPRVFKRSFSEPSLDHRRDGESGYTRRPSPMKGLQTVEHEPIVYLPRIRSEVCASSPTLSGFSSPSSSSPINQESNQREGAKVVISVAVEGSPGPVRAMIKLSSNVEETIKIVVEKYCKEGRTPKLHQNAYFELHHSHFSIQCLDKGERIGDLGRRRFYLRKRVQETGGVSFSGIAPVRTNLIPSSNLIESCIAHFIGKIVRRTRKIWNILICVQ